MSSPETLGPILTTPLFPQLEKKLVELLESLTPDEWEKQTLAPKWKVKDVAAHLLDTELRRLSFRRDSYSDDSGQEGPPADLVSFVNSLNQEGVSIFRRLSPKLLISLIASASAEMCEYFQTLDPMAVSPWGVSWAGEEQSLNWFDIAREFTERWHHQEQIRVAVGKPGIMTRELYYPVLDCFMRALPFHYRNVPRPPGTAACFKVVGECGGNWYLLRDADRWELTASPPEHLVSETQIPQEIAWRIFTKGIAVEAAQEEITVRGDAALGSHILQMVSIVASPRSSAMQRAQV